MRRMPCAMGKRDVGSDAPAEDSFLLWLYPDNYLRWKISHDPHAAGTDKGNLRDAGETCACQSPFILCPIFRCNICFQRSFRACARRNLKKVFIIYSKSIQTFSCAACYTKTIRNARQTIQKSFLKHLFENPKILSKKVLDESPGLFYVINF